MYLILTRKHGVVVSKPAMYQWVLITYCNICIYFHSIEIKRSFETYLDDVVDPIYSYKGMWILKKSNNSPIPRSVVSVRTKSIGTSINIIQPRLYIKIKRGLCMISKDVKHCQMSVMLHKMAGSMSAMAVSVVRPSCEECVVSGCRLVPGDVLALPPAGCVMPCDALLLTGSCIVNESMLTGKHVYSIS